MASAANDLRRVYAQSMGIWAKAFRFTALFLVLFTAGELVACEMPGSDCSALHALDKHSPDKQTPVSDNDNCICCCAHPVVTPVVALLAPVTVPVYSVAVSIALPSSPVIKIDRPPQLT
jgi:hypothetical protein